MLTIDPNLKVDIALIAGDDKILDVGIGEDGDLSAEAGLDTAIRNDTQAELRASEEEQPIPLLRSGWIGNETPNTEGYTVGSKLYFYYQVRNTLASKNGSVDAVRDTLNKYVPQYLKEVQVVGLNGLNGIEMEVILVRYNGETDKLYFRLLQNTGSIS